MHLKMTTIGLALALSFSFIGSSSVIAQDPFEFSLEPVKIPPGQATPKVEVHTLNLPGVQLKGEEINYKVKGDGKHDIQLHGQSAIKINEVIIAADDIHVTYSKLSEAVLELKGSVSITSIADRLRVKAIEAQFDFSQNSLTIKGDEEKDAVLYRINGPQTTLMEAAEMEILFTDRHLVSVKSKGPAQFSERSSTKEDTLFTSPFGSQDTLIFPQSPSAQFQAPVTPNFPQFGPLAK